MLKILYFKDLYLWDKYDTNLNHVKDLEPWLYLCVIIILLLIFSVILVCVVLSGAVQ